MTSQAATEFPVPDDLEGFWVWDRLHCPRPLAPLDQDLIVARWAEGFTNAMADMDSVITVALRFINYYPYLGLPRKDLGGMSEEEALQRCLAAADRHMPTLLQQWENDWLPGMLPALEKATTTDYASLDDDALLAMLEELAGDVTDRWTIHGKLNYAFYAAGIFGDFYNETFEPDDETEAYEVLQGFPTTALDSARGLWNLSRAVRADERLLNLFNTTPPEQIVTKLDDSEVGRDFKKQLLDYLEEFGWRADTTAELRFPSWREDPAIAVNALTGYLTLDDSESPDLSYEASVKRREELLAQSRERLANDPEKLARFNELYELASCFTPVVEDHNHYIDQMGDIALRYPALEIGKRLAARGVLESADDVFFLYQAELPEAMGGKDFKETVRERRAEFEHWSRFVPPPVLGIPTEPSGDPVEDLLLRFFGTPVEPSDDPTVLMGIAASPGSVTGPAKVVRDLAEASKLQPGDVLVCEMTLPPWTPLFATASAVVADTGGMLSHCAIVAREYRIPCVVGTNVGTITIKDGDRVTVDGSQGVVRIER